MKTMFFSFWQHKKVLFLISLPSTPDFQRHESLVNQCLEKLRKEKVTVGRNIDSTSLSTINKYDVVIIVAHLDENSNELALADRHLPINTFVDYLPEDFSGVLDFSSCYAAQWIKLIKRKCPNCHVQGASQQTVLDYRLIIYPHVIRLYRENKSLSYHDAYMAIEEKTKAIANKMISEGLYPDDDITSVNTPGKHLGWPSSVIYAPTSVERNTPFIVQLYIKSEKDSDRSITIRAKKIDPDTGLIKSEELPIKLKKGDGISVQYVAITPQKEDVQVENAVQHKIWLGKTISFEFNVVVFSSFRGSSFNGKVLIEVNKEPIGSCSFKTIVEKADQAPADISLELYDFKAEMSVNKDILKKGLLSNLQSLQAQLTNELDNQKRQLLESSMATCQKCMKLIDMPVRLDTHMKKTVFVSSTCDEFMKPFRETIREVVEELKMNADLCGDWPQSGSNPADVCCQKVMDSDIYVCILGGRYGYIEPSLNTSMTEMEFHAAFSTHKKILAFVLTPPNESNEPDAVKLRQNQFVNYLKTSRILREFKNVEELKVFSRSDLQTFISSK